MQLAVAHNRRHAAQRLPEGFALRSRRRRARRRIAHHRKGERGGRRRYSGRAQKRGAPAQLLGAHRQRPRRCEVAQAADREHEPRHGREAARRKPARERHQRTHQPGRAAKANQAAPENEGRVAARRRERESAAAGDQRHTGVDPPRAVAVQRDAEGDLRRRENQKISAADDSQRIGRQLHLARQFVADHADRRPVEHAQDVAQAQNGDDCRRAPRVRRSLDHAGRYLYAPGAALQAAIRSSSSSDGANQSAPVTGTEKPVSRSRAPSLSRTNMRRSRNSNRSASREKARK